MNFSWFIDIRITRLLGSLLEITILYDASVVYPPMSTTELALCHKVEYLSDFNILLTIFCQIFSVLWLFYALEA